VKDVQLELLLKRKAQVDLLKVIIIKEDRLLLYLLTDAYMCQSDNEKREEENSDKYVKRGCKYHSVCGD
jgi:hypothetical protein